jgi:hypothetical protein
MPAENCPHCGVAVPAVGDAFCATCHEPLDEPPPQPPVATPRGGTIVGTPIAPRHPPASLDWALGLLAGACTGAALAMIFVEPYWITPESRARLYVGGIGIVSASAVCFVRNRLARKEAMAPPSGRA